ncbi:actin polymerization protein Bzz1 [Zymoseptoria brevis]|uniref:Protein BZZ1 n=1 Tax=Zymoseptoria brevis TaxID=1047168 RepID=A0A0F4GVG1_9PEZI|nr:actin polymerization protein Bzz1 [Zymoseptoria brevis]
MAELEVNPQLGIELKDGFKPVNAWVGGGIAWLDDMQQFYRERSAIEKEYSQKLSALAKKYFEKKAKKTSSLSVGDTPTITPGSLESASMTTWTVQLTTLENRAAEHDRFSNQLVSSLAEPLKHLGLKYEDLRKQHAEYASKLEKERDANYADLRKAKSKYDSVCQEVENRRKKTESSFDHGKAKAQTAFQQQQGEMRNAKNLYLIAINVTNKQKERYYHEYVPELIDSLQALAETKTAALNNLWSTAASLETQVLTRSTQLLEHLSTEIPRNNPVLDSMMFVRHNASPWQDPPDFAFEPSPVWLDDDVMASDPMSKTFLMNILVKSRAQMGDFKRESDMKRREVDGAKRVRQAIREGKDKRDEVEVVRSQFVHQNALHEAERRRISAEVEVSTILAGVGDVSVGARNHTFKNQTYKIPTSCDLCGDRLWGLNAKGMNCEECGFTCHTKCELKVPADCPGELTKEQKKAVKAQRQAAAQAQASAPAAAQNGHSHGSAAPGLQRSDTMGSMNTLSSGYAASAKRSVSGMTIDESGPPPAAAGPPPINRPRVMAPPPSQYLTSNGGAAEEQHGKMLYTYQANGEGELSITEGQSFILVEPDDGSGWIKVRPTSFGAVPGLVPSSYAELAPPAPPSKSPLGDDRPTSAAASASTVSLAGSDTPSTTGKKKQGPAVAPRRGAKKVKHVVALYTYAKGGEGETDMEEGEKMVLVAGDSGDGWVEVESLAGKGVVPASWVRDV